MRGADGEPLARCGRGITQSVQASVRSRTSSPNPDISAMPPALSATDRTVRCKRNAKGGEHANRGDADAVKTLLEPEGGKVSEPPARKADQNCDADDQNRAQVDFMPRERRRWITVAEPVSEVAARACVGSSCRRYSTR